MVGRICVDAGIVMVGDPGYHLHHTQTELQTDGFSSDWDGFCDSLADSAAVPIGAAGRNGHALALVIGNFGGDGIFPVYIKRDAAGAVAELIVRFERFKR